MIFWLLEKPRNGFVFGRGELLINRATKEREWYQRAWAGDFLTDDTDEAGFLIMSKIIFRTFFIEHKFSDNIWEKSFNNYGSPNPRLGLYIIGFFDFLVSKILLIFDKIPYLVLLRFLVAALSAGCIVLLYKLVEITASDKSGVIAALLLLINPIFRSVQVAILLEVPMTFFTLLALQAFVHVDQGFNRSFLPWKWLCILGISIGMAISCKLYAFALYPILFVVLIRNKRNITWKVTITSLFLIFSLGFVIFTISNPLLYSNFLSGIKVMTVNHLGAHHGLPTLFNLPSLKYILTYPFIIFRALPFGQGTHLSLPGKVDCLFIIIGYILLIKSIVKVNLKRRYLALVWMASSFMVISFVTVSLPSIWVFPKAFLLPAISLIWLFAYDFFC